MPYASTQPAMKIHARTDSNALEATGGCLTLTGTGWMTDATAPQAIATPPFSATAHQEIAGDA